MGSPLSLWNSSSWGRATQGPMPHPSQRLSQPTSQWDTARGLPRQFLPQKASWVRAGQGLGQSALSPAGGRSGGLLALQAQLPGPLPQDFRAPCKSCKHRVVGAREGVCAWRRPDPSRLRCKRPGKRGGHEAYAARGMLEFWGRPSEGAGPATTLPLLQERPHCLSPHGHQSLLCWRSLAR